MSTKEYRQQYYQRNKHKWVLDTEEKKEAHRVASRKSQKKRQAQRKEYEACYWKGKWEYALWSQAKRRAGYAKLEFTIDISDIVIPDRCPYLDIPLTKIRGQGFQWTNASIDRIDNTKGYIKGNIQIVSRRANAMKQAVSLEELVTFAKNVLLVHKKENCS